MGGELEREYSRVYVTIKDGQDTTGTQNINNTANASWVKEVWYNVIMGSVVFAYEPQAYL